MKRKRFKSIFYINYSPYENSGNILDFLLDNFKYVYLFSIAFHPLGKKQKTNRILIYKNRKIIKEIFMGYIPVHPNFVFFLIPIRSLLNTFQLFWHIFLMGLKYGKVDIFFSVNAFTSWIGIILKKLGLVRKTIFWVWDYYPIYHKNRIIMLMRWLYWQFDKWATKSDKVVYLNHRLVGVRKEAGLIGKNSKYTIVPIGTEIVLNSAKKKDKKIKIGFIGVLKKTQGLDLLFDAAKLLKSSFPSISYEIIGSGPDSDYFRKRALRSKVRTNFYGYVDEAEFAKILSNCTIGIAPYVPDDNNLSTYGDPGKVKRYLSFGLPSIITDVFEFSEELVKSNAGLVIDYYNHQSLAGAIKKIMENYSFYSKNAFNLNKKYYYKKIYSRIFDI